MFVDGGEDFEDSLIARTLLAPLTEEARIRNNSCICTSAVRCA